MTDASMFVCVCSCHSACARHSRHYCKYKWWTYLTPFSHALHYHGSNQSIKPIHRLQYVIKPIHLNDANINCQIILLTRINRVKLYWTAGQAKEKLWAREWTLNTGKCSLVAWTSVKQVTNFPITSFTAMFAPKTNSSCLTKQHCYRSHTCVSVG